MRKISKDVLGQIIMDIAIVVFEIVKAMEKEKKEEN